MTTNGGKEKPPTRDMHQKKRRKITRFCAMATCQSEAGEGEEEGGWMNATHGMG
jgi:hypothetical protein